jgi:hypothetical protein
MTETKKTTLISMRTSEIDAVREALIEAGFTVEPNIEYLRTYPVTGGYWLMRASIETPITHPDFEGDQDNEEDFDMWTMVLVSTYGGEVTTEERARAA